MISIHIVVLVALIAASFLSGAVFQIVFDFFRLNREYERVKKLRRTYETSLRSIDSA